MEEILHHLGWYMQAKSCIYSDFWVVKLVQDFIQPCKTSGQAGVGNACMKHTVSPRGRVPRFSYKTRRTGKQGCLIE